MQLAKDNPFPDNNLGWHWMEWKNAWNLFDDTSHWVARARITRSLGGYVVEFQRSGVKFFDDLEEAKAYALAIVRLGGL